MNTCELVRELQKQGKSNQDIYEELVRRGRAQEAHTFIMGLCEPSTRPLERRNG